VGSAICGAPAVDGEDEKMSPACFDAAKRLACLCLCALLLISGCGYTTRSMISGKYKTIYIQPCVNKIDITLETSVGSKYKVYRPHLETDITRAITNKFLFDGNLKPMDSASADLVLKSDLVDFRRDPLRYDTNDEVEEYRINIALDLNLWDNRENKSVWQEKGFTGDSTYFTPPHTGAKSDELAVNDAITDIARRVVERTVEEW